MSAPATCAVAVAGGGPVGAAAALALHGAGLDVHWLAAADAPAPADRPLALSRASLLLLERLDARTALDGATTIDQVIVSQRGGFGRVVMTAAEARVPALGCVAAYRDVQAALAAAVQRRPIVCHPAAVTAVEVAPGDDRITATCADGHRVSAQLLVCADGRAANPLMDGPVLERDYGAMALTANLATAQPHRGRAFERFTADGPIALLPRGDGYALVWTLPPAEAERLLASPDREFRAALAAAFGAAAGPFTG
ncbi:MAG: FAD-dependent monooxygenase, partial [Burkholderiales bacterium]